MRDDKRIVATNRNRLDGAVAVATAALSGSLETIEGVHAAIARRPFAPLRAVPGVSVVSEVVRGVHDGITGLVYECLRVAFAVTGTAARVAAELIPAGNTEPAPGSAADLATAALNGFAGERLERDGNALVTAMGLRRGGRMIVPERAALTAAFPGATSRLAIFVHGLACSESMWWLHAERHYGDRDTTYGSRLQMDLGYTPLYVRYNTGLHISTNGRRLAQLIDRIVSEWPVPVDEVLLVGHSMGGLVIRSASHYGREAELQWLGRVRHVFLLGSPHHGAPLEKLANVAGSLLARIDITRPFAAVVNARSAGIKDLRFGALLDEHWEDADLDALLVNSTGEVPLIEHANHYFVAATVTRDAHHPLGVIIGDLLVRTASALGHGRFHRIQFPLAHGHHFGPMNHLELLNHPDIYDQMRRWLEESIRR